MAVVGVRRRTRYWPDARLPSGHQQRIDDDLMGAKKDPVASRRTTIRRRRRGSCYSARGGCRIRLLLTLMAGSHYWLVVLSLATATTAFSNNSCWSASSRIDGRRHPSHASLFFKTTIGHSRTLDFDLGKIHRRSSSRLSTMQPPLLVHSTADGETNLVLQGHASGNHDDHHLHHARTPHNDNKERSHDDGPAGSCCAHHAHSPRLSRTTKLSLVFWCIALLSGHNTRHGVDIGLITSRRVVHVGSGLLSLTLALPVLLSKVHRTIFQRGRPRLDASCLMLAASLGAVGLGDYTEAAAVASLFAVSEALEGRAAAQSMQALAAVANDLGPGSARLLVTGTIRDDDDDKSSSSSHDSHNNGSNDTSNPTAGRIVPADQVLVGSHVLVLVGEKIPCNGQVVEGHSHVDESTLTGESHPQRRIPGDTVLGGGINVGPECVVVQTTALSSASAVARLAQLVKDARREPSPLETLLDQFAAWYVPPVFGLVVLLCILPWILYGPTVGRVWAKTGLVTLVAACPCPLVISTPVTYVSGLTHAARHGIIVKGGGVLEALGKVQTIAMDKTGTLTQGEFSLRQFFLTTKSNTVQRKDILEHLALVESLSSHPIATAVTKFVLEEEKVALPPNVSVTEHTILEGEGVAAIVQGKGVHIGNARLVERLGLYDQLSVEEKQAADDWANSGATVSFMSMEGLGVVCCFAVADGIRPEAPLVLRQLQDDFGTEVYMLTGDLKETALAIGRQVNILPERIYSSLLPEEKLQIISELKGKTSATGGKVLMCGDGVNDAPALAVADVGVAMGSGASLATQTSDVTLTHPINLRKLVTGLRLGRRVRRTLVQNFSLSLGAKAAVVALAAFGGVTSLWAAIASDVVTMLLVTTNGLKLISDADDAKKNDW